MNHISGGVCAAQGYKAAGTHCGLKKKKPDLALIYSITPAVAAATYTTNVVKAAPLHVTKRHLADGMLQAVVVNSGNANACAPDGEENARAMCASAAKALGLSTEQVAVSSTGVIGVSLTPKMELIQAGITALAGQLADTAQAADTAAYAIMTTDLTKKEVAAQITLGGEPVRIGGMAKGSGMIHPNMGTMLGFLTTDAAISSEMLEQALQQAVNRTFNRISVDGDTSTNDFCLILANGLAENPVITTENADYETFVDALTALCTHLARLIAADGEGATHLITCTVQKASDEDSATAIAKSVISSSLVKSAVFGQDANWGRILCAAGYSGVLFDPNTVTISFASQGGEILVCKDGQGVSFNEEHALEVLAPFEVEIHIDLAQGTAAATCWGCDLTYEYVKINGEYRT